MSITNPPYRRVIVYVDGFNFYFGLKDMGWRCHYWLDFPRFAANLTKGLTDTELVATKYFTARVSAPEDKRIRQKEFLEVLELRGGIGISYGDYKEEKFQCSNCVRPNFVQKEKQTDVNIAVQLIMDAYKDNYDVAVLISGDSDLVPAIKAVKEIDKTKQIISCFPPKRYSKEIRGLTSGQIHINEIDLKNSQLPAEVTRPDGYVYKCPDYWK